LAKPDEWRLGFFIEATPENVGRATPTGIPDEMARPGAVGAVTSCLEISYTRQPVVPLGS